MTGHSGLGTVVVTGATGALGRPIVERLARRGHQVVAIARSGEALAELDAIPGVTTVRADLSQAAPALDHVISGSVAGVVHAAGASFGGSIMEVDAEVLLAGVDLKVNGFLRVVRAVDGMLQDGARLVAVGGNLGFDPTPGAAVPGVANAALANVVRQLSRALGPRGVTAHLLAPGPVDTPRLRARAEDEARHSGDSVDAVYARYATASPLGRLVAVGEITWAVEVLFAPEAAALTGSTLFLDTGSRTALP